MCNCDSLLDKFQEMHRRLAAGLSYRDYFQAYQQLYSAYKKENTEKYRDLIDLYKNLWDLWYAEMHSNHSRYDYYDYLVFRAKYDNITECFNVGKINIKNAICTVLEKSLEIEKGLE
jgi:hypothetical protein